MQLTTTITPRKSVLKIEHQNKIITMGSCFAENIAKKFIFFRFNILDNPFGVLYNPVSIYNSLKAVVEEKDFKEEDLVFDQSEWHSFYHHSDFSSHDKNLVLSEINKSVMETRKNLSESEVLIITFGTAYVYKHKETGIVVSNCHKIPQNEFEHYRIGMYEAREFIQAIIELARDLNPKIKIILTLSPVRHLKDGFTENQLSKSILMLAIQEIINEEDGIFYFPSYEIMLDGLRDYRFYGRDLVHPNDIAIDYIWENFTNSYFSEECSLVMNEVGKITSARDHKTRNPKSKQHQKFLVKQIELIHNLQKQYPHLSLEDDLNYFQQQIE